MGYKIENKNKLTSKYLDQKIKEEIANISRQIVEKYKPEKIILLEVLQKENLVQRVMLTFWLSRRMFPTMGLIECWKLEG